MTPKELEQFAKVCRKHGIAALEFKGQDVRIEFNRDLEPTAPRPAYPAEAPIDPITDDMSPEDVLMWSATPPGSPVE